MSQKCCVAIEDVFRNDSVGEISFEVLKGLYKRIVNLRRALILLMLGSSTHCQNGEGKELQDKTCGN